MGSLRVVAGVAIGGFLGMLPVPAYASGSTAPDEKKPTVSEKPLTNEQLTIYRTVLRDYLSGEKGGLNLSFKTSQVETEGPFAGHECSKKLDMEPVPGPVVHLFQTDDLARLGIPSSRLVDPDKQSKEVQRNDPGKQIRSGVSVDDAVKNGFAHALFSLSEIWFDKKHEHAIVSYSFWCGSLCGNGGSLVLIRKGDSWAVQSHCGGWYS